MYANVFQRFRFCVRFKTIESERRTFAECTHCRCVFPLPLQSGIARGFRTRKIKTNKPSRSQWSSHCDTLKIKSRTQNWNLYICDEDEIVGVGYPLPWSRVVVCIAPDATPAKRCLLNFVIVCCERGGMFWMYCSMESKPKVIQQRRLDRQISFTTTVRRSKQIKR